MSLLGRAAVFALKEIARPILRHVGEATGTMIGRRIQPDHEQCECDDEDEPEDEEPVEDEPMSCKICREPADADGDIEHSRACFVVRPEGGGWS